MEFRVLGQLEVVDESRVITLGSHKQRSLLALLLMNQGSVVSTDRIIDLLWGEGAATDRQNALWVHVSNLRKELEPDRTPRSEGTLLLTRAPGYLINVERIQIDSCRFEDLVAEGRTLVVDDPERASTFLRDALEMWRGRAYEEFSYDAFAQEEIARLDEVRLEAVGARIEADLNRGLSAELVSELETLVRQQPMRERFTGQLMIALYRSNRQAEALRAFQALRSRLGHELGVDASPDLRDLEGRMLEEDPTLRAPDRSAPGSTTPEPGLAVRGYEIREELGSASVGVVHRAFQPALGREVAIRSLPPEVADDPDFIRSFETRSRTVAGFEHPHVVPLYDYWREPGAAYLVSRLMDEGSLADLIESSALDPARAATTAVQLANALDAAHRIGLVHGNLAPADVLFDADDNAYLSDFGLSEVLGRAGLDRTTSAPEVVAGAPPEPPADCYSLAVVMAQGITGMRGSIDQIAGALPPAVSDVINMATATDPRDRPTAARFAELFASNLGLALDRKEPVPFPGNVENPYRGLAAFDSSDADVFFGRQRVVDRLVSRLGEAGSASRFVALVGPSGSGKSSVVRAGLLPALAKGALPASSNWFVTSMTPGAHPFEALEAALIRVAVDPPPTLFEQLVAGENGLRRAARRILPDDGSQLVIVIDQFEELFTVSQPEIASSFLDGLAGAVADDHSRVRIVLTLRADFYDRPLRHRAFGELLREGTEVITAMSPEELEQAIVRPAEPYGIAFSPALVAEMVHEVAGRPGALPLLQYALTELFEQRRGTGIDLDTYREIGGVSGALASRAESLFEDLGPQDRDVAQQVFLRLVTLGEGAHDTRRRALASELEDLTLHPDSLRLVLDLFSVHRLLTYDRDPVTRGPTVEISHEALLSEWSRLSSWIDGAREDVRNQRRLAAAMAEWSAADRRDDHLLAGGRLDQLDAWARETRLSLSAAEREFLDASTEARTKAAAEKLRLDQERAEAETRARRRLRQALLAGGLTVVVGLLAVVALLQGRAAQRSEERVAATLRAQELAAASVLDLRTDSRLALRLALEAASATTDFGVVAPEAMDALHWAVQEANLVYPVDDSTSVAVRPGPRGATGVFALSPDELIAFAQTTDVGSFTDEECRTHFPERLCPDPARSFPADLSVQGGEEAYGVVPPGRGALAGTRIEVNSAITADDRGFIEEMSRFENETGIVVASISLSSSTGPEFELARRVEDLEPFPDILLWPQPAQLAGRDPDSMIDLAEYLDLDVLQRSYGPELLTLGTVGDDGAWPASQGALYGLPTDVDVKGLVLYA